MNVGKAQIEILKELFKNPDSGVAMCDLEDGVAIALRGVLVYKIPHHLLRLDLEGVTYLSALPQMLRPASTLTDLKPTDEYRNGGTARKYLFDGDKDKPIYVNVKLLANFTEPCLVQAGDYNPRGPIVVQEFAVSEGIMETVGAVMPARVENEEE